MTYRGHPIPTKPPNNLQRQSILALAVLALHPGEVVAMTELAAEMQKLGRREPAPGHSRAAGGPLQGDQTVQARAGGHRHDGGD